MTRNEAIFESAYKFFWETGATQDEAFEAARQAHEGGNTFAVRNCIHCKGSGCRDAKYPLTRNGRPCGTCKGRGKIMPRVYLVDEEPKTPPIALIVPSKTRAANA